jgi:drug/metabolite transporter (DMT)-like permease
VPAAAIAAALFSALLHASWNALLKGGKDRLVDSTLVAFGWAVLGGALLLVAGPPPPVAYPFVLGSAAAHALYWAALTKGYETGDLSHVYTLSRGAAPAIITLGAAIGAREVPETLGLAGIALVCLGVLCVGASPHASLKATLWALAIAATIGGYSLIDALGARASANPSGYVGAMLIADAAPIAGFCILRRTPARLFADARRDWRRGLVAGVVSGGGYAIVLWAQTFAPLAQVSALRETSVVFASVIAWAVLKEKMGVRRWAGALVVAAGAVCIALA